MNCARCGAPGVTITSGVCGPCSQRPYTIPAQILPGAVVGMPVPMPKPEPKPVPTKDELVAEIIASLNILEGEGMELKSEWKDLVDAFAEQLVKLYERTK